MTIEIERISMEIDVASDKKDEAKLSALIEECKKILQEDEDESAVVCYFLANAYSGLRKINHKSNISNIWLFEQSEVFQEIYYLRRAILANDFNDINVQYKMAIFTNLGSAFSRYGRPVLALEYFNKALNLNKDSVIFAMALCNKAICLENYAKLNYNRSHNDLIARYSYFNYKDGHEQLGRYINGYDSEYYQRVRNDAFQHMNEIEGRLTKKWLKEDIDLNDYQLRKYKNEQLYRHWVLDNKLFLNPINDLGNFNIATHDPLNLPNLLVGIDSRFPKYITYFNQIKQEYTSCRVLLYEGIQCLTRDFYDKEISIIDDYDYNQYNIHTEKIKLSFRGFYSLLDKIANFINDYFALGIDKRFVNFRIIWKHKEKFKNSENLALRGLYLISKDLYFDGGEISKEFMRVAEPEAKEISEIRNHLEHKFMSLKVIDVKRYVNNTDRERCFHITQDNLENKTIKLAKLVREAIIYLSFTVHTEEVKKKPNNG